jgi:hypothetical protein
LNKNHINQTKVEVNVDNVKLRVELKKLRYVHATCSLLDLCIDKEVPGKDNVKWSKPPHSPNIALPKPKAQQDAIASFPGSQYTHQQTDIEQ